jgi:transcriptional regulator with XRE-family HTH domain
MDIGGAIKLCRTRRKLTQATVAKKAGVSVSYLSLVERNERHPPIPILENISRAVGVPFSILVFLAAGPAELEVLGKDIVEKLSFVALAVLEEQRQQPSLL